MCLDQANQACFNTSASSYKDVIFAAKYEVLTVWKTILTAEHASAASCAHWLFGTVNTQASVFFSGGLSVTYV